MPKENISSAYFKYSKNLMLTAVEVKPVIPGSFEIGIEAGVELSTATRAI
jgi:hypothetical protein